MTVNGAGEQQGEGAKGGTSGETLEGLQKQLGEMKEQMSQLGQAKTQLEGRLEGADRELLSPEYLEFMEAKKGGKQKGSQEDTQTKENLDEMSPKELAAYLTKQHKGDLEGTVKEIGKRMDAMNEALISTYAQVDLSMVCIRNPDLDSAMSTTPTARTPEQKELVDTMYTIAKDNPGWNATKCLRAARLEMKANVDEKAAKAEGEQEKERKALTEKSGLPSSASQLGSIGKDKAADLAWKATFGNKQSVA